MRSDRELWIVGEGDQYGELLHLAGNTPGIRFLGRVSNKELLDLSGIDDEIDDALDALLGPNLSYPPPPPPSNDDAAKDEKK